MLVIIGLIVIIVCWVLIIRSGVLSRTSNMEWYLTAAVFIFIVVVLSFIFNF